jgi:hypothetical protein
MTAPDRRRLLIVFVLGVIALAAGMCAFVERQSRIQDGAAEGLDYVQDGGTIQGYQVHK